MDLGWVGNREKGVEGSAKLKVQNNHVGELTQIKAKDLDVLENEQERAEGCTCGEY